MDEIKKLSKIYTKKEIAEKLGVTRDMLYKYLRGAEPRASVYKKILELIQEHED